MKTNLLRFVGIILLGAVALRAAPVTATTAVHVRPDRASLTIGMLKVGTEPTLAPSAPTALPPGWSAVELPGPFEIYVENKDLTKSLDMKPGAAMRLQPKADAPVLGVAEKTDKATITGLRGKWTQLNLEKPMVGYINVGGASASAATMAPPPASTATAGPAAPFSTAPIVPPAYGMSASGQPAPMVNLNDSGPSSLPRQFSGKFVSTRRPLTPRRPFDWALLDDSGKRLAYVDVSRLLQTQQIARYQDHYVVLFGTARTSVEGKDLVIQVESLQLR